MERIEFIYTPNELPIEEHIKGWFDKVLINPREKKFGVSQQCA